MSFSTFSKTSATFKVTLDDDIRRITLDRAADWSIQHLSLALKKAFGETVSIFWMDDENERISVKTDADLCECISEATGPVVKLICERVDWIVLELEPLVASTSTATTALPETPQLHPYVKAFTPKFTPEVDDAAQLAIDAELQRQSGAALHCRLTTSPKTVALLPDIVTGATSADSHVVAAAIKACRQILSKEVSPPIAEVISAGLVHVMVDFLNSTGTAVVATECFGGMAHKTEVNTTMVDAAWALTNIASGDTAATQAVIDAGAIPIFVELLGSSHAPLADQVAWALGNLAGNGSTARDQVLEARALPQLLALLSSPATPTPMMRNITWTISNLCRGKVPSPTFDAVAAAVPALCALVHTASDGDTEVTTDAAWALSYLTDGSNSRIQKTLDAMGGTETVLAQMVALLRDESTPNTILTPTMRTIGNVATGNEHQTQAVLDAGVLPALAKLLTPGTAASLAKEAAWTLSNITAGSEDQIQAVLDAGLIDAAITALDANVFDSKVQKESTFVIANMCHGATTVQLRSPKAQRAVGALCSLLDADADVAQPVVEMALEAVAALVNAREE